MVKHQLAGMPLWQWLASAAADSSGGDGGLAAAGAAANSIALVGAETRAN